MSIFESTTEGIRIIAEPEYVEERSSAQKGQFFFKYQITIENDGDVPVQLMSRHWIITNALGEVEQVRGEGVVGEQPRLEPGMGFRYVSACPLSTQVGSMKGSYQMRRDDGSTFDVEIPAFTLATPFSIN